MAITCQEFCKQFDVYIAFSRNGFGQIFGKGSHPPKYDDKLDFYIPTDGGDTGLLPQLVSDYDEYSKPHKAVLISPTGASNTAKQKPQKNKDGYYPMSECNDFKDGDSIETNVETVRVMTWPDTIHLKLDEMIYHVLLFDGKHHFMYDTKSAEHPAEGQKFFLKAKIKKQTYQINCDIPCFEIGSVKILKEKKKWEN